LVAVPGSAWTAGLPGNRWTMEDRAARARKTCGGQP
jgi:hypothetical protein